MGTPASLCSRCLRVPKRGGHCRSLASHVNSMIKEEADPDPSQSVPGKSTSRVPKVPLENLAARVAEKLEEGDFEELFA